MMGGIHTNIEGRAEMSGLWCAGEASCNKPYGANRLGANSTSECLVWGNITGMHAEYAQRIKDRNMTIPEQQVIEEEKRIYDGIFHGRGDSNPYEIKKRLADLMDSKAYVFRDGNTLAEALKEVKELKRTSWKHVDDKANEYNTNYINVMEIDSIARVSVKLSWRSTKPQESRGSCKNRLSKSEMTLII